MGALTEMELRICAYYDERTNGGAPEKILVAAVRRLAGRVEMLEDKARRVVACCDREGQACSGCVGGLSYALSAPTAPSCLPCRIDGVLRKST